MAVVFSLPWALLIWSYVHSYSESNFHLIFFYGIADISNRMLLSLTAVILYSWSVSSLWSRIVIASVLVIVFFLLVGWMRPIWGSSDGLGVWLDGVRLPVPPALRALHVMIARLRDRILSSTNRFHPTTDNGNGRRLAGPGDGVISGTV